MSEQELDAAVIKATQQALGKFIKKPPLTDKLLKKPPFRYLMDVFNSFIKQTGCFEGLYTPEEQLFENISDRNDKTRFLQKMIDVTKLTTKLDLKVRTSKIVAGQEAKLTNELLQAMASVAEQRLEWEDALQQVLEADEKSKPVKAGSKLISPTGKEDAVKRLEKRMSPQEQKLRKVTELASRTTPPKDKAQRKSKPSPDAEAKSRSKLTPDAEAKSRSKISPDAEAKSRSKLTPDAEAKSRSKPSADADAKSRSKPSPDAEAKSRSKISPDAEAKSRSKPSPDAEAKSKSKVSPESKLSRQGSKQKTPSPVKPTTKLKQQASSESEAKSMSPSPAVAPPPVKPLSPASSTKSRADKTPASNLPEPLKEPTPPATTAAAESWPSVEPESRKSSSKSRRSSGTQRQPPSEPEPMAANETSEATTTSPTVPTADTNNNNNNNDVKREREGTFTRENSKESNGSLNRPRTSLRPPSARPASARPGAPRRRNVEIVLQPNDQVKMSGINVKLETFGDFDDDGENLVIIEDANAHDIEAGAADPQLDTDAHQGRLVQQILETQKELVQQGGDAGKEEQQKQNLGARQSSARQVNDLRDIIQTLTKSVNPLGKLMDFIPEDIDAMQLELTMWRDTYTQAATELKRERNLTASATEPMKQQLRTTEASIEEYKELVDESRHKILQSNERILKMLMEQ